MAWDTITTLYRKPTVNDYVIKSMCLSVEFIHEKFCLFRDDVRIYRMRYNNIGFAMVRVCWTLFIRKFWALRVRQPCWIQRARWAHESEFIFRGGIGYEGAPVACDDILLLPLRPHARTGARALIPFPSLFYSSPLLLAISLSLSLSLSFLLRVWSLPRSLSLSLFNNAYGVFFFSIFRP